MNLNLLLILPLFFVQSYWHKEICKEGNFSFEMPLEPTLQKIEKEGLNILIYTSQGSTTIFSVTYMNWGDIKYTQTKDKWESTYANMKQGAFNTCDPCQLINETDLSTPTTFMRDFTFWQVVEGETYIYHKRTIFKGNKVYVLTVGDLINESSTVFELVKYFHKAF